MEEMAMTFSEWFKKEYPIQHATEKWFKDAMRRAWNAAATECLNAIRQQSLKKP